MREEQDWRLEDLVAGADARMLVQALATMIAYLTSREEAMITAMASLERTLVGVGVPPSHAYQARSEKTDSLM